MRGERHDIKGIQTRDSGYRTPANLRLRKHGQWDRCSLSFKKYDLHRDFMEILGIYSLLHFTACSPCKTKACYFRFHPAVCSLHYYLPAISLFNVVAVTVISGGRLLRQQTLVAALRVQTVRQRGFIYIN